MSAAVGASVCNVSGECRRMRPSILGSSQKAAAFKRTGSHGKPPSRTQRVLRATQDSARTKHQPIPAKNGTPRGNATGSETRKGHDEPCTQRHSRRHRRATMRKTGTYTRLKRQQRHSTARAARGAAARQNSASAPRPHLTDVRRLVKSDASAHHSNESARSTSSPKQEIRSETPTRPARPLLNHQHHLQ